MINDYQIYKKKSK